MITNKLDSKVFYHLTPERNLEAIKREGLVPQIGPRAAYASSAGDWGHREYEDRPEIYLFAEEAPARRALSGWFTAWQQKFKPEEGKRIALLKVKFSARDAKSLIYTENELREVICSKPISAKHIEVLEISEPKVKMTWDEMAQQIKLKSIFSMMRGANWNERTNKDLFRA